VALSPAPNPWLDQHYAAPQTLVKIGRRRRLNLLIAGEGAPTVIFAAGLNGTMLHWARVQPAIALRTRTVAFDKAGLGFSDPGPMPRTAAAVVQDLRTALAAVAIPPPYVLVGHSQGGPQMRLFAFLHPQEVAGLVLVDSSGEYQDQRIDEARGDRGNQTQRLENLRTYSRLARLTRAGALTAGTPDYERAVGAASPQYTPALWEAHVAERTSPGFWRALRSEAAAASTASSDQVTTARRPLGHVPLIVLTAGRNALPRPGESPAAAAARHAIWQTMHDEMAALSTRGERRTVDAGHGIPVEKPDAVIAAIEKVLAVSP
jgi:pimeloyl-ACP methyl ester carboxylesterase